MWLGRVLQEQVEYLKAENLLLEPVDGAVEPGSPPGRQRRRDGEGSRLASGGKDRDDQAECLAKCLVKGLEKAC